jgi:hypothetical protein
MLFDVIKLNFNKLMGGSCCATRGPNPIKSREEDINFDL